MGHGAGAGRAPESFRGLRTAAPPLPFAQALSFCLSLTASLSTVPLNVHLMPFYIHSLTCARTINSFHW